MSTEAPVSEVTADFVSYGDHSRPPILLQQTCGACPEQYDAWMGGQYVAYLRLRHGYFTVELDGPNGQRVYEAQPEGDGIFDPAERDRYLTEACDAIAAARAGMTPRPGMARLHRFPLDMCEIRCPDCGATTYPDDLGEALDWAMIHKHEGEQ